MIDHTKFNKDYKTVPVSTIHIKLPQEELDSLGADLVDNQFRKLIETNKEKVKKVLTSFKKFVAKQDQWVYLNEGIYNLQNHTLYPFPEEMCLLLEELFIRSKLFSSICFQCPSKSFCNSECDESDKSISECCEFKEFIEGESEEFYGYKKDKYADAMETFKEQYGIDIKKLTLKSRDKSYGFTELVESSYRCREKDISKIKSFIPSWEKLSALVTVEELKSYYSLLSDSNRLFYVFLLDKIKTIAERYGDKEYRYTFIVNQSFPYRSNSIFLVQLNETYAKEIRKSSSCFSLYNPYEHWKGASKTLSLNRDIHELLYGICMFVVRYCNEPKELSLLQELEFWANKDWHVIGEDFKYSEELKQIGQWYALYPEIFDSNEDIDVAKCLEYFHNHDEIWGCSYQQQKKEILKTISKEKMTLDFAIKYLLDNDYRRAHIKTSSSMNRISDPTQGIWELWDENATQPSDETLTLEGSFNARNPLFDIPSGGVVGIDFGTKSTTVVRKIDGEKMPIPMRVGSGSYDKMSKASDYENPTFMQFINTKKFIEYYKSSEGRPNTYWNDLTISHDAERTLKDSEDSSTFSSFLAELKQWAGGNHILRIKDRTGYAFDLQPFMNLKDEDIDPIELYAYYIGLHINNIANGIYLHYELSYPVTYDRNALERLRLSFERGLKKSLPLSVLHDEQVMKNFKVYAKTSEPAAYAVCALKEYQLEPQENKPVFYGVFDFGGGTTDFDYGLYRLPSEEEEDFGYDYYLEHFRPSGDKYLGGENLLQLISYEVFKNNASKLLEKEIPFSKPLEKGNTSFRGEEGLVDDSSEANLNMRQMMEKLRPIWENIEVDENGERYNFDSGQIKVNLFNRHGDVQAGLDLDLDRDSLENIIQERISQGVSQFFFKLREILEVLDELNDVDSIHIFLAGNSSRSKYVELLFNETIKAYEENSGNIDKKTIFDLHKPLGFDEEQESHIETVKMASAIRPSGKTGVAYGLIWGREGNDGIKIINKNFDEDGDICFRYYVGVGRRGKFEPKLTMETEKNEWVKILNVGDREQMELRYSDLPAARTGLMSLESTTTYKFSIDQPANANKYLFARIVSACEIEYTFAEEVEQIGNEVYRIKLGE